MRITVIHPFSLRPGSGKPVREFPAGEHSITRDEYDHWFLQACLEDGRAVLLADEDSAGNGSDDGVLVTPTKEELMGMKVDDLKAVAEQCGIAYPERATKSQLADLLLAGREGVVLRINADGIHIEKAE